MRERARETLRMLFPSPAVDNPATFTIPMREGWRGFRVVSIQATHTNNDAAVRSTKINFGTATDLNYWGVEGPLLEASAASVLVCAFIGGQSTGRNLAANEVGNAGLPDIVWNRDLHVQIHSLATSYNFAIPSVVVEYLP